MFNMTSEELFEYVQLYFTTGVRWVCMGLVLVILLHQIFALLRMRNPSEIWAYLRCPDGSNVPLTHWENLVGRGRGCDVILNLGSVSRSHGTLIRDSEGVWKYNDLESKNGSLVNGRRVMEPTVVRGGDVLTIGGSNFQLYPVSLKERMANIARRKSKTKITSPWLSMIAITAFQVLAVIQLSIGLGEEFTNQIPMGFGFLSILMWAYVITMRAFRRKGFEVEVIAFFLSTMSLALTATAFPGSVMKQAICIFIGLALFIAMCWFLRDLNRAKRFVYILMGIGAFLLILNLVFGATKNGSQNWVVIAGFSFQPSEIVKIIFIFVGAATLDELQKRKNLLSFMGFSIFCLGCLAVMGDFGTAIIFYVIFLIISFLRSGDFTKLILIIGATVLMGLLLLRFKPYIAQRFETWGHVWDDPTGAGFQQVQSMCSIASGGIPGLGAGEGNFSDVAASSTDLVFGLISEEWGLVTAILCVMCIITLGVFAYRCIVAGRSTYYSIAACAATSLFVFQTLLNVFGSLDLFPFTGVTFPFVSSGGTSMIASWGLLAFVKAADTRQNASFAIRLDRKSDFNNQLSEGDFINSVDINEMHNMQMPQQFQQPQQLQSAPEHIGTSRKSKKSLRKAPPPRKSLEDRRMDETIYGMPAISEDQRKPVEQTKPARPLKPAAKQEDPILEMLKREAPQGKAQKREEPKKPHIDAAHPKKVNYNNLSDDEFFGKFGLEDKEEKKQEDVLRLEDIFDDLRGDRK